MSPHILRADGSRVVRDLPYDEWIARPDRNVTREECVAFHNLALRTQIVPLIRNAIAEYDAERRAYRWDRRLVRWLIALNPFRRRAPGIEERLAWLEVERRSIAALDDLEDPRDG